MRPRLQRPTSLNPQAQLPRTQQEQRQRQHDSTHPQLEKLSCYVAGDADGHSAVFQDAVADDRSARPTNMERVFPSGSRTQGPLDLCGAEGFLSCDLVHHTLYWVFISVFHAIHLYFEASS